MSRSHSAAKVQPCPDKEGTEAAHANNDKVRIQFLKETLCKMLREPQYAKKAASIIEEMIHSGPKSP